MIEHIFKNFLSNIVKTIFLGISEVLFKKKEGFY